MKTAPIRRFLRCSESAQFPALPPSDYPLRLLTRRTFAELTGQILKHRETAPQPIAVHPPAAAVSGNRT